MTTVFLVKIRTVIFYEVGDCGTAVLAHLPILIIPPTTRGVSRDLKVQCFLYQGTPPDKLHQTYTIHVIVSSNNTPIPSFGNFVGKFRKLPEFVKKLKNNIMHRCFNRVMCIFTYTRLLSWKQNLNLASVERFEL